MPGLPAAAAAEATRGTFLGDYRVSEQRGACAEWPYARVDPRHLEAPRAPVPVLFMNGTDDSVTPPENARRLAAGLSRSRVVEIDGLPHNPGGLSNMGCYDRIINDFFARPEGPLDTSCTATMKPPRFRTGPDPR